MATIYELKRRAQELSAKKDSLSISPDEVGGLIDETLDVINEAEKNQVGLGIRNTYTTVSKMNADSTSPTGSDGKPLKFGQIVTVYDESHPDAADNGNIYAFQNPGWKLVSTTGNLSVYAKKEDVKRQRIRLMLHKRKPTKPQNPLKKRTKILESCLIMSVRKKHRKVKTGQCGVNLKAFLTMPTVHRRTFLL